MASAAIAAARGMVDSQKPRRECARGHLLRGEAEMTAAQRSRTGSSVSTTRGADGQTETIYERVLQR